MCLSVEWAGGLAAVFQCVLHLLSVASLHCCCQSQPDNRLAQFFVEYTAITSSAAWHAFTGCSLYPTKTRFFYVASPTLTS